MLFGRETFWKLKREGGFAANKLNPFPFKKNQLYFFRWACFLAKIRSIQLVYSEELNRKRRICFPIILITTPPRQLWEGAIPRELHETFWLFSSERLSYIELWDTGKTKLSGIFKRLSLIIVQTFLNIRTCIKGALW